MNGQTVSYLALTLKHQTTTPPTWQKKKAPSAHLSHSKRPPGFHSPICFSTSAASSVVALGRMPGSVKLVLSREKTTNTNSNPPITGMNTVRCSTRNGQLLKQRSLRVTSTNLKVLNLQGAFMNLTAFPGCEPLTVYMTTYMRTHTHTNSTGPNKIVNNAF